MSIGSEEENTEKGYMEIKHRFKPRISDTADTFLENVTCSVTKASPSNPLVSILLTTLCLSAWNFNIFTLPLPWVYSDFQ